MSTKKAISLLPPLGCALALWLHTPSGAWAYCTPAGHHTSAPPIIEVNSAASPVSLGYGPAGDVIRGTGPVAKTDPLRSSPTPQDDATDLIYYGYRYYNAGRGIWLSRDPSDAENHLHGFAHNNPGYYLDTLGDSLRPTHSPLSGALATAAQVPIPPGQSTTPELGFWTIGLPTTSGGYCGQVQWNIWWQILNATANTRGGVIVQEVTIDWDVKDCSSNTIASIGAGTKWKKPCKYWESWPVPPNSSGGSAFQDNFGWSSESCQTRGSVTWTATASFYQGVYENNLDNTWMRGNPQTGAGNLLSSTSDQKLGRGSNQVKHELSIKWDCCGQGGCCQYRNAEIVKQQPKQR
jgi:RHS repeat-associated protein